ncbi:MAG: hypothetical protein GY702_15565, partial [Desulfobulbaceae bacterium]|nr:hypothetical protein [Desulfobulbaceae bacterium]
MYKKTLQILFILLCCLYSAFALAATQTIHVEWGYTPPSEPALAGFRLYKEGATACETGNPNAVSMDCVVSLEKDSTNFTLTALFEDGSESPHSPSFPFNKTSEEQEVPPDDPAPETDGSHAFTFNWQLDSNVDAINGYRIYLNESLLCETDQSSATSITCNTDLINGLMTFSMTTVDLSNQESTPSNILVFDPTLYPTLFNQKQITLDWEYTNTSETIGFKAYQNGK